MEINVNRAAVVGCGTIGCGWATYFALKGIKVNLFDQVALSVDKAMEKVECNLEFLRSRGEINDDAYKAAKANVKVCYTIEEAVVGVDFVQEAVSETYEIKKALFRQLDQLLPREIILASSSSGLLMTEIQTAVERYPGRCVIGHPINPVFIVPLVEIVPGKQTDLKVIPALRKFYESIGKVAVTLKKEIPGYLENRLTAAIWREAIDLVINDVATVEDVDKTIWAGPGLRYALMGPLLIYHIGGGEGGVRHFCSHIGKAAEEWWKDMNTWTTIPEGAVDILEKGITESMHGRTIQDVCDWRDNQLLEVVKAADIAHKYGQ